MRVVNFVKQRINSRLFIRGYSLIEGLVYLTLIVVIGSITVATAVKTISAASRIRMMTASLDNARRSIYSISQEVARASDIYSPTSEFLSSPGQLSLVTTRDLPEGETQTYVDFFVDDGHLYMKRESINFDGMASSEQITAENVVVENMTFMYISDAIFGPAVRIQITVAYDTNDRVERDLSRINLVAT